MIRVHSDQLVIGKRYSSWGSPEDGSMVFAGHDKFNDPIFHTPTGEHIGYSQSENGQIYMYSGYFYEVSEEVKEGR